MKTKACYSRWAPTALARLRLPLVSLIAAAILTGCVTVTPVSPGDEIQFASRFNIGDVVSCEMRNGMDKTFRLTAIKSGWLIGESDSVYVGDAVRIQVRPKSVERVIQVTGALVLVGAAAYLGAHPPAFLP